jgi:hypothetical protein
MPEVLDLCRWTRCRECGQLLDEELIRMRIDMHGECAEKAIARSAEIFEIYRNGGRIEGLFDGVGPP